jgi:hypothetical protein
MSFELTPTTELGAVNTILLSVGSQPVSSLDSGISEAYLAQLTLHQVNREIQKKGLNCNSEEEYPLTRDSSTGTITLPTNTLRVDVTYPYVDAVQRGARLYNLEDHTFVWTQNAKADIVFFLSFDDLPEHVKHYVYIKAARKFQRNTVGSSELEGFTARDELEAKTDFLEGEAMNSDESMLDADGAYQITRLRHRL